jgi:hypothetical protein
MLTPDTKSKILLEEAADQQEQRQEVNSLFEASYVFYL